jgi:hypothetical protein
MARKIQPADWDVHKLEIETLYLKQNQNLEQLMKSMEDNHGFSARLVTHFFSVINLTAITVNLNT